MNIIKQLKTAKIVISDLTSHQLNRENKVAAVWRFLKWQIRLRITANPLVHSFTEKSKLIINKGMPAATGNLYCGLHEYYDMSFLLHFLRPEDLFVDIGANIGSYTVLASAHIGAASVSVEPVPSTFTHLIQNININQITGKVTPLNIALGSQKGDINFTASYDAANHVATSDEQNVIKVPVETLDAVMQDQNTPALLKIDVEGFETEVIKGALKTLENDKLKAVIIELNGSGWRYGYNEQDIHNTFLSMGFSPYVYNPKERSLSAKEKLGASNTIYIRDLNFVKNRVETAPPVTVLGITF
ncbi:MAG TPA: FkbM family methyltransferase [Ferruginibacter sp.]|nr:FkbM family methyltransferase [Ferruginibacter sp.]HPH93031.1 FkbM family methyltransferase [Ferruginibacter sp.]